MGKPCPYKQSSSASSLHLMQVVLPQAIPKLESRGENCCPAQHLLPQFCLLVCPPTFPVQRRLKCQVCFEFWSSYMVFIPPCCEWSPGGSQALCPGEPGPVACWAHHFLACTVETPLHSLTWAEGTFDFKSCCYSC